jgi:hypothetical protein
MHCGASSVSGRKGKLAHASENAWLCRSLPYVRILPVRRRDSAVDTNDTTVDSLPTQDGPMRPVLVGMSAMRHVNQHI